MGKNIKFCNREKAFTLSGAPHIDTLPKSRNSGFTKPSRATSASESPTIMSVMDIPTNWRRWRLLRGAVKQKSAFTLAEVLITLGIIGVVSALTLPVLIQNINGHKYRNQFKKSFSTLSQAVKLAQEAYELSFAMLDQTCEDTGVDTNPRNNRSICAMFNGTLKGATYVGPASDIYKEKDIKIGDYPISDYLVYRLSDGSLVGFYKDLKTCTVPTGTQLTESVLTGSGALKNCLGFIDVNGDKNPNDLVQGTSAESVSWLFGMPTAFGYGNADPSHGYSECDDAVGPYPDNTNVRCYSYKDKKYVYMTYEEFNEAINHAYVQGYGWPQAGNYSEGYAGCTRTSNGYNCYSYHHKSYMDIPEDDYSNFEIYDSLGNLVSAAGYNAQGQYGYGYDDNNELVDGQYSSCTVHNCGIVRCDGFDRSFDDYIKSNVQIDFSNSWSNSEHTQTCFATSTGTYLCYGCGEDFAISELKNVYENLHNNGYGYESGYGHSYGSGYDGYDYGYNSGGSCSASTFDPSATCSVPNRRGFISDIFPIVFHDGVVEPASGPARAVLHQAK